MRSTGALIPRDAAPDALADAVVDLLATDLLAGWVAALTGKAAPEFCVDYEREHQALAAVLRGEGNERRLALLVEHGSASAVAVLEKQRLARLLADKIDEVEIDREVIERTFGAKADGQAVQFVWHSWEGRDARGYWVLGLDEL
jgi:hypothetical protein